jgi:hypothetical protein
VLYRSTDSGATWRQALVIPAEQLSGACPDGWPRCNPGCPEYIGRTSAPNCPQLIVSPNVVTDGLVLYRYQFQLFRSLDAGASFNRVTAAGDQLVQQVLASPDFSRDRMLVLAASSGHFAEQFFWDPANTGPARDHEQSMGVLISNDGGETWTQA